MLALCTTPIQEICSQGLDKNMLVLYFTLKYFNYDRNMDTLLSGNKNAVDLKLFVAFFQYSSNYFKLFQWYKINKESTLNYTFWVWSSGKLSCMTHGPHRCECLSGDIWSKALDEFSLKLHVFLYKILQMMSSFREKRELKKLKFISVFSSTLSRSISLFFLIELLKHDLLLVWFILFLRKCT